jgi:hypothetical protein
MVRPHLVTRQRVALQATILAEAMQILKHKHLSPLRCKKQGQVVRSAQCFGRYSGDAPAVNMRVRQHIACRWRLDVRANLMGGRLDLVVGACIGLVGEGTSVPMQRCSNLYPAGTYVERPCRQVLFSDVSPRWDGAVICTAC